MPLRPIPGKKRIVGTITTLTEAQYRHHLRQGIRIPQGTELVLGRVRHADAKYLKIRFFAEGGVEVPYFYGEEGNLKVRFLHAQSVNDAIRLVSHQIGSVKTNIGQAKALLDTIERLHFDVYHNYGEYADRERTKFREYFQSLLGELSGHPLFMRDKNKVEFAERIEKATKLLEEGNVVAASGTVVGLKNNLRNLIRKLSLQEPRLVRRRSLVVDKKFERDSRIFGALDLIISAHASLGLSSAEHAGVSKSLARAEKLLYATGWKAFRQPAIILEKAAEKVHAGELKKARDYLKDANRKIVISASSIASIYPQNLRRISQSRDEKFKQEVLSNQLLVFHDMMPIWMEGANAAKRNLILSTLSEQASFARGFGKNEVAQLIESARGELENGNLVACSEFFSRAALKLDPEKGKELS
ncbi:MAG: hypothetical protein NUV67_02690 [archaeon]|nr:hypothetical protein [archaeon]